MAKRLQVYETPAITVTFDPNACRHSGVCLMALPKVFDLRRKRWIRPELESADAVSQAVARCPSGALQYYRNASTDPSVGKQIARAMLMNRLFMESDAAASRSARARAAAEAIRHAGGYRWVGIYDVLPTEISAVGWTGEAPPAHPRFLRTQGLAGAAADEGTTVVANDVERDPRHLSVQEGMRAEMVVPVIDSFTRQVVGTLDVASEREGGFGEDDRALLEACARVIGRLWK